MWISIKLTMGAIPVVLLREFSAANVRSALQDLGHPRHTYGGHRPGGPAGATRRLFRVARLCLCSYPAVSRLGRDVMACLRLCRGPDLSEDGEA